MKLKNIIIKIIFIILSAIVLFTIIKAVLHRDYPTLIYFVSAIVGYGIYQVIDSKLVKSFRKKVKNPDLFNSMIWIISIFFVITNFAFYVLTKNKLIANVYSGLIYPTIHFSMKYWDLWMEDTEKGNTE
jgi:hypothetical protein